MFSRVEISRTGEFQMKSTAAKLSTPQSQFKVVNNEPDWTIVSKKTCSEYQDKGARQTVPIYLAPQELPLPPPHSRPLSRRSQPRSLNGSYSLNVASMVVPGRGARQKKDRIGKKGGNGGDRTITGETSLANSATLSTPAQAHSPLASPPPHLPSPCPSKFVFRRPGQTYSAAVKLVSPPSRPHETTFTSSKKLFVPSGIPLTVPHSLAQGVDDFPFLQPSPLPPNSLVRRTTRNLPRTRQHRAKAPPISSPSNGPTSSTKKSPVSAPIRISLTTLLPKSTSSTNNSRVRLRRGGGSENGSDDEMLDVFGNEDEDDYDDGLFTGPTLNEEYEEVVVGRKWTEEDETELEKLAREERIRNYPAQATPGASIGGGPCGIDSLNQKWQRMEPLRSEHPQETPAYSARQAAVMRVKRQVLEFADKLFPATLSEFTNGMDSCKVKVQGRDDEEVSDMETYKQRWSEIGFYNAVYDFQPIVDYYDSFRLFIFNMEFIDYATHITVQVIAPGPRSKAFSPEQRERIRRENPNVPTKDQFILYELSHYRASLDPIWSDKTEGFDKNFGGTKLENAIQHLRNLKYFEGLDYQNISTQTHRLPLPSIIRELRPVTATTAAEKSFQRREEETEKENEGVKLSIDRTRREELEDKTVEGGGKSSDEQWMEDYQKAMEEFRNPLLAQVESQRKDFLSSSIFSTATPSRSSNPASTPTVSTSTPLPHSSTVTRSSRMDNGGIVESDRNAARNDPARNDPRVILAAVERTYGFINGSNCCWLDATAVAFGAIPLVFELMIKSKDPGCRALGLLYKVPRTQAASLDAADQVLPRGTEQRPRRDHKADATEAVQALLSNADQTLKQRIGIELSTVCERCTEAMDDLRLITPLISDGLVVFDLGSMIERSLETWDVECKTCNGKLRKDFGALPMNLVLLNENRDGILPLKPFRVRLGNGVEATYSITSVVLCARDGYHYWTLIFVEGRWIVVNDLGARHAQYFDGDSTKEARMVFAQRVDGPEVPSLSLQAVEALSPVSSASRPSTQARSSSRFGSGAAAATVQEEIDERESREIDMAVSASLESRHRETQQQLCSIQEDNHRQGTSGGGELDSDVEMSFANTSFQPERQSVPTSPASRSIRAQAPSLRTYLPAPLGKGNRALATSTNSGHDRGVPTKNEAARTPRAFDTPEVQSQPGLSLQSARKAGVRQGGREERRDGKRSLESKRVRFDIVSALEKAKLNDQPFILEPVKRSTQDVTSTSTKKESTLIGSKGKKKGKGKEKVTPVVSGINYTTWVARGARTTLRGEYGYESIVNEEKVNALGKIEQKMKMEKESLEENNLVAFDHFGRVEWMGMVIRFLISATKKIDRIEDLKELEGRKPPNVGNDFPWNLKKLLLQGDAERRASEIDNDDLHQLMIEMSAMPQTSSHQVAQFVWEDGMRSWDDFWKSEKVTQAHQLWKSKPPKESIKTQEALEIIYGIVKDCIEELEGEGISGSLVGSLGDGRFQSHDADGLFSAKRWTKRLFARFILVLSSKLHIDVLYSHSPPTQQREAPKFFAFASYKACYFLQVGMLLNGQRFLADFFCVNDDQFVVANLILRSSASIVQALHRVAMDCGYVLTLEGLFEERDWLGNRGPLQISDEREVYKLLDLPYRLPVSRRGDAAKDKFGYKG